MAESLDCPKCGAPLTYNSETQGDAETIACPYCGESVIVPVELRKPHLPPIYTTEVSIHTTEIAPQAPPRTNKAARSCLIFGVLIAAVIAGIIYLVVSTAQSTVNQNTGDLQALATNIHVIVAATPTLAGTPAPEVAPTAADSPTPTEDITATAQVESQATRAAQLDLITTQANWPVVLQEKFANDRLHWTTGTDNNNLAIEDFSIANNKYTWKITTKKSMASFSFPDMGAQTDLYVSVDLQLTASSGNSDDQAGIVFRRSEQENSFYFFGVNPDRTYSLSMYDGSGWNDLIPVSETALLKPKQVNHLAVSMQDNQILLVINNSVVDSFEDTQLSAGAAGLGFNLPSPGEDATVVFTNFFVRAPKK